MFAQRISSRITRSGVLADFFIGAHAAVLGCGILTRDARSYGDLQEVPVVLPDGC